MSKKHIEREDEFEFEEQRSDNKELLRFVNRVLRSWYCFAVCGVISLFAAFLYLRYTTPIYKVHAKLLVSDDKKGGGMLSSSALGDLSGLMGAKNSVDNEVEVLRTADLMREMVLAEQAYIGYYNIGKLHDVPIVAAPYRLVLLSSPDSISTEISLKIKDVNQQEVELSNADTSFRVNLGKPFVLEKIGRLQLQQSTGSFVQDEDYGFSIRSVRKTVSDLMGSLSVEVTNKLVSTIDLTLDTKLPKSGEKYLATLIQKYMDRNLHDKNVIADSTLSFINARLRSITYELAGVEDKISGYKQSTQLADITEQSKLLLQHSADYTKSLAELETQLSALDGIASYLQDAQNPRVVPSSIIPQDVVFNDLASRYNDLVLQRERLLMANTENNPLVQNINAQIAGMRADMIANVASTRRNLELAQQSQQQLAHTVTSQISRVPTIERGYIDLARLQQIKQAQYIFLQEKWEETAISRTANVSNSKIIDTPKVEENPFSPKRNMILALGLIVGLIIPLAIFYIKDLLNVRVQGPEDIQAITNLPILGAISHSDEQEQVVVSKTSRTPIAEQFRATRTNLEFSLKGGKRILFTSSMSGEGKSFVALNLAIALALLDKKVLVMELDLRKPSITSKLGLSAGNGFSHYVVRPDMKIEDIIMSSQTHENVDLIQAGVIPPNPAELLIAPRAVELMNELEQRYDYIIIDAPPVGMVTDAQLLSRYADTCLYLVRQGYTYKEQLRIPNDLINNNKIKPIQLIINDIKAKGSYYNNYDHGYGYGYGYGDYGQQGRKRKWWEFFKR